MEEEFKRQINSSIQNINGFLVGFDQAFQSANLKEAKEVGNLFREWEMGLRLVPLSFEAVLRKLSDYFHLMSIVKVEENKDVKTEENVQCEMPVSEENEVKE